MIKLRKHTLYVEVSHPRAGMKVSSAYSLCILLMTLSEIRGQRCELQTLTRRAGTIRSYIKRAKYISAC